MPSLNLSNPFRRRADRPSIKDRAVALKATAARMMKRKPTSLPVNSEPFSLKGAASLSFEGIVFEGETRTLPEWEARLAEYAIAMVLAEHFLKMGKPEMEASIRELGDEGGGSDAATILRNFDATQETLEGWSKLLSMASARYTIASSSLILAENPAAEV